MAYQKIVVNTGLSAGVLASDTNHIPNLPNVSIVTGTGDPVASGTTTSANTNTLIDTSANFVSTTAPFPVVAGDLVYNLSNPGNSVAVSAVATSVTMNSNIFNAVAGGENYLILRYMVNLILLILAYVHFLDSISKYFGLIFSTLAVIANLMMVGENTVTLIYNFVWF